MIKNKYIYLLILIMKSSFLFAQNTYWDVYDDKRIAEKNNKFCIVDTNGNKITDYKYDEIDRSPFGGIYFKNNLALVKSEKKYGLINNEGKEVIPCKYDRIEINDDNLVAVKIDKKWGIIKNGKEIIKCKYDVLNIYNKELIAVKKNNKWGVINEKEENIIAINQHSCKILNNKFISVGYEIYKKQKLKLFSNYGFEISNKYYDEIKVLNDSILQIKKKNKFGFINNEGKLLKECVYKNVIYNDSIICVKYNNKWSYLDNKLNKKINKSFDSFMHFSNTLIYTDGALISKNIGIIIDNNKKFFINTKGEILKECNFEEVDKFSFPLTAVKDKQNKWGFIDSNFKLIIPCQFDCERDDCINTWCYIPKFIEFNNQYIIKARKGEKYSFVNIKGNNITPWSDCSISIPMRENEYTSYCVNGKYGLIDNKLEIVIPAKIDEFINLGNFHPFEIYGECQSGGENNCIIKKDDLIPIKINNKCGFININGEIIIPTIYDTVNCFVNGIAEVSIDNTTKKIDSKGNIIK